MAKFKVGDRVRYLPCVDDPGEPWQNVTITELRSETYCVGTDPESGEGAFPFTQLELIEPALEWIKHDGGPMPVPGDTGVLVKCHGELWLDQPHSADIYQGTNDIDPDGDDWWLHGKITEYAIVTPSPSAETAPDPIARPEHYTSGEIECIDAIRAQMTSEAFRGFLRGNIAKYVWRYEHKGGAESLRKSKWYLDRLIAEIED